MHCNWSPAWAPLALALLTTALLAASQPVVDLPENSTVLDAAPPGFEPLPPIEPSTLTAISLAPGAEPVSLLAAQCTSDVGRDCAVFVYCISEAIFGPGCLQCAIPILDTFQITDETLQLCEECVALPDEDNSAFLSGLQAEISKIQVQCAGNG